MAFGVYVHIPYCRQICPYCDFTKYEFDKIMPPADYVALLAREIRTRASDVPHRELDTIYFGGGTPSLFEPELILAILDELAKAGFRRLPQAEVTLEIDPATCDEARLESYLALGINRFSIGAQTFNERLLKIAGRKHSSLDTVRLLSLLRSRGVNYSFDLLFGLPTQTLEELRADVATAIAFAPSHLSAYCLTVPEGHPMSVGRAPDEEQVRMFALIEEELARGGIFRYEISNFAKPGFESRHNSLYWQDQPYWGLGTGAHSYFPGGSLATPAEWGLRFSNAPSLKAYAREMAEPTEAWVFARDLSEERREALQRHHSLSDFCHTSLRLARGLQLDAVRHKFGSALAGHVETELLKLLTRGLVSPVAGGFSLTVEGRLLANQVFEKLTFLPNELDSIAGPDALTRSKADP